MRLDEEIRMLQLDKPGQGKVSSFLQCRSVYQYTFTTTSRLASKFKNIQ